MASLVVQLGQKTAVVGIAAWIFGISLFSTHLGPLPITVSDVVGAMSVVYVALHRGRLGRSAIAGMAWVWFTVAVATSMVTQMAIYGGILFRESVASIARAATGVALVSSVPPILRRTNPVLLASAVLGVIRAHMLILWADALLGWAKGGYLLGQRYAGLFVEPAWLGWFIGTLLFVLAQLRTFGMSTPSLKLVDYVGLVGAIVIGMSLTALVIIGLGLGVNAYISLRQSAVQRRVAALTFAAVLIGAFVTVSSNLGFSQRILAAVLGADSSSIDRIAGSLEVTRFILRDYPLTGVGLGNELIHRYADTTAKRLQIKQPGQLDIHIGFASAFATTGLMGGLLYCIVVALILVNRGSRLYGLGLVSAMLSYGGYLSTVFWWFIGMGAYLGGYPRRLRADCAAPPNPPEQGDGSLGPGRMEDVVAEAEWPKG